MSCIAAVKMLALTRVKATGCAWHGTYVHTTLIPIHSEQIFCIIMYQGQRIWQVVLVGYEQK